MGWTHYPRPFAEFILSCAEGLGVTYSRVLLGQGSGWEKVRMGAKALSRMHRGAGACTGAATCEGRQAPRCLIQWPVEGWGVSR